MLPADDEVWGHCDWCRRQSYLQRHSSGKYACPMCQLHPEWSGEGTWGDYKLWLSDRGLAVDGWKHGWREPAADVP